MKKAETRETAIVGKGEIVLYQTSDGRTALDVRLEQETLWLSQKQLAVLFQTERSVITKHLRNIFRSGELLKDSVCAKFAHTAEDGKTYQTLFYNLDSILSVGYRVNSVRGTHFRIWATNVLRDHILKGYSVNQRRLKELRQSLKLVENVLDRYDVTTDQARALMRVVLWFMEKNGALYRRDASKRIADNALVAIILMIAESSPAEMGVMVKLIVNLINSRN